MYQEGNVTPYEKIFLMNNLMGHQGRVPESEQFWTEVRNQSERVVEEINETHDAIIDEDLQELIDGVADSVVTLIGLYQKLQLCGVDIDAAFDRICDNNLTKFHRDPEEANLTAKYYQDQGVEVLVVHTALDDGSQFYSVVRKSDRKLLKPYNYEKVDLTDIVENSKKLAKAIEEGELSESAQ